MKNLLSIVESFEGISRIDRRTTLLALLKKQKVTINQEKYYGVYGKGTNLIVECGNAKKTILIVTHYDAFFNSPGANDNASSIAVHIALLQKLKTKTLNHKLMFAFCDQEEIGCQGSSAYIRKHGMEHIKIVLNTELVGMGEIIGVWPISPEIKDLPFMKTIRNTLKKNKMQYQEAEQVKLFYGDYVAFRDAGKKESICFTMIPKEDVDSIRKYVNLNIGSVLNQLKLIFRILKIPKLFRHYHNPADQSKFLSEEPMQIMTKALYHIVLALDRI